MQTVDVLRDDRLKLALLFQICQCQMRLIRLRVRVNQIVFIIIKKRFRMLHKKCMRKDLLRRIAVRLFGMVQPLFRAKIRNIALGRNARTAKKHDILTLVDDFF